MIYLDDGRVVSANIRTRIATSLQKWRTGTQRSYRPRYCNAETKAIDAGLLSGKIGASVGYWLRHGQMDHGGKVAGDNEFLLAAQLPAQKATTLNMLAQIKSGLMSSSAAITTNCNNVALAARYLDYGYTEEGHILYNFGIEGESFNWVEKDGTQYPQFTDIILKILTVCQ